MQRLADEIAALLEEAAEGLRPGRRRHADSSASTDSGNFFPTGTGWFTIPSVDRTSGDHGLTADATARWLDDARRLNRHVPRVDRALTHAEESRRINVRALGSPESARSLRGGLEALEMCSVAVRSLFRSIDDWVRDGMIEPDAAYAAAGPHRVGASCSPTSPSWSARSGRCCGPRSRAGRRPRRRPCPTRWTGCGSTASRHAEPCSPTRASTRTCGSSTAPSSRWSTGCSSSWTPPRTPSSGRTTGGRSSTGTARPSCSTGCGRGGETSAPPGRRPAPEGAPPEERPSRGKKAAAAAEAAAAQDPAP